MTDRRTRQTILLLGTLLDVQPAPDTWTGRMVERSTRRGPAPSRYRTCADCQGRGFRLDRFNRETSCGPCGGRGRYPVDDYTGEQVRTTTSTLRIETARCDRCDGLGVWRFIPGSSGARERCTLCDGSGRRPVTRDHQGQSAEQPAGRSSSLDLWGKDGSWHELDQALNLLHMTARLSHRLVWVVHITRERAPTEYDSDTRWALGRAVEWLSWRMPDPIIVPSWAYNGVRNTRSVARGRWANGQQLARRDKEIRRLAREGKPQQWIAREFGLTPARVSQLVNEKG